MGDAVRRLVLVAGLVLAAVGLGSATPARSASTVPPGFEQHQVATGLTSPTAMAFLPDGRILVTEQEGDLRVIKDGAVLLTPFVHLDVSGSGERGLVGVTVDPGFATNRYVYAYYTTASSPIHNRVSRFTANGDVAAPNSEVAILDLDNLSSAEIHNGGAIHFGPDGKLYVAVGDNAKGSNAQTLTNRLGKILRVNKDGTIPTDNPFYAKASGLNRAIWAMGLRNPFGFSFEPGTGRMFIDDVGENSWEEINDGRPGGNYGWPATEGPTSDPRYDAPIFAYAHGSSQTTGCAITGGAFYTPPSPTFPSANVGDYFFADLCNGWIRRFDPSGHAVSAFAAGIPATVAITVTDDGSLYYLTRGAGGAVFRVTYTGNQAPTIATDPTDRLVSTGHPTTFSVEANGAAPLSYQWLRDGQPIGGATADTYTLDSASMSDDGAKFRVTVSNAHGSISSAAATLSVTTNQPPDVHITAPATGSLYRGGQTISYAGSASDPETGALPAAAYTWQVDFHHAEHVHPFLPPTSGATSGAFDVPTTGHTEANVFFRVLLTVTDPAGLTTTAYRDVLPHTVAVTVATSPAGLTVKLDDQPHVAPTAFTGVVGVDRHIEAPTTQSVSGKTYDFARWSDGGARSHVISTPSANTTYTATYRLRGDGLTATYFDNDDFTGPSVRRVDPTIDFSWGAGAPAAGIGADTFSVRWVGLVRPDVSGTYTFFAQTDDGSRLWINGRLVIDNWAGQGSTERSGTATLTGGVPAPIRVEYREDTGAALAHLRWSGPSIAKTVVPQRVLFSRYVARINFQPQFSATPPGYYADTGSAFGLGATGERFGWNADNSAQTRDRNAAASPDQRYDTFALMQAPSNPGAAWELMVPNGTYTVHLVAGDPTRTTSRYLITVEGVTAVDGRPTSAHPWREGTVTVTVSDNRLTVRTAAGAVNNKICYLDLS